jgi:hypothetical protein
MSGEGREQTVSTERSMFSILRHRYKTFWKHFLACADRSGSNYCKIFYKFYIISENPSIYFVFIFFGGVNEKSKGNINKGGLYKCCRCTDLLLVNLRKKGHMVIDGYMQIEKGSCDNPYIE